MLQLHIYPGADAARAALLLGMDAQQRLAFAGEYAATFIEKGVSPLLAQVHA